MAILRVPKELLPMFKADPENFIRDIANFPQETTMKFFRNIIMLNRAVKKSVINPFDFKDHRLDEDFFAKDSFMRFMHFDLSLGGDLCAFAMGHSPRFVETTFLDKGVLVKSYLPYNIIDVVGILLVERNEEVWLPEITNLVETIYERGFNIGLITFDRFQSAYIMQDLRDKGFLTAWLSIDRTTSYPVINLDRPDKIERKSTDRNYLAAISTLKDSINQGRLEVPYHPSVTYNTEESEFEIEAKAAEINTRKSKVDHPADSRIDLLQAVAGVVFNIHNNVRFGYLNENDDIDSEIRDNFYKDLNEEDNFSKPDWEVNNETYI